MLARRPTRLVLIAAAMSSFAAAVASLGGATATAATVNVTLSDFGIRLSTGTVPPGRIVFRVLNRGNVRHDFEVDGAKTRVLAHASGSRSPSS